MGRTIWRDQPLDFLTNAEFSATRVLGFEAEPAIRRRSSGQTFSKWLLGPKP